jgi:hypothetical protein
VPDASSGKQVSAPGKTDVLTVFFTGNELGALKPCGCSGGQLGGLDRRAVVFNSVPEDKRLIIDTGSLVENDGEQDLIKFNIILQAFRLLDYDVVNLSERDIETGMNLGLLDSIDSDFELISPHYLSNVDIADKFTKRLPLEDKTVLVTVATFDEKTLPIEQIERLYSSTSEAGDTNSGSDTAAIRMNILILNNRDEAIIDYLSSNVPFVDCVVLPSESDEPMVVGLKDNKPFVISIGRLGRYLSGLRITKSADSKDVNKLEFSFFSIPVTEDLEQQAALVELYKDYQQIVKERNLLEKHPRFTLSNGLKYMGSSSCKVCHEYEYEKWSGKAHARAYATLEKVGSQFDPECVICHVVGMDYESGFVTAEKTGHLKDVGCENCHGPGSAHIKSLGATRTGGPMSDCIDCHTPEQSGEYAGNEEAFMEKIIHWKEPDVTKSVK